MKTFKSRHNGEEIIGYLTDDCAVAAEEAKRAIGTDMIGTAVARLAQVAITNQDNEAWTLFTIANEELAKAAGATAQQIEAAHRALESQHNMRRVELRAKYRTQGISL